MTWLDDYGMVALRVHRQLTGRATGALMAYRGPAEWVAAVDAEERPPPAALAEQADALLETAPSAFLAAQVRALRAQVRPRPSWPEQVRECLGVDARPIPTELLDQAHDELDRALPPGRGTPAERLAAWRSAHALPPARVPELPALVDRAVAETRRRTSAIVPLPDGEVVSCRLESGVPYRAAGEYRGGLRSVVHINRDIPFNLADLLSVVAHEGHPGHIAESLLKDGRPECRVRFLVSPAFVLSEGLGLHAEAVVFPGDEAQRWLAAHGVRTDGADLAALHRAENALFGAWANAAGLLADGHPEGEVVDHLVRWALLSEAEAAAALATLRAPGMDVYVAAYWHGWRLLEGWLTGPDRVRRLLTEPMVPADLDRPR